MGPSFLMIMARHPVGVAAGAEALSPVAFRRIVCAGMEAFPDLEGLQTSSDENMWGARSSLRRVIDHIDRDASASTRNNTRAAGSAESTARRLLSHHFLACLNVSEAPLLGRCWYVDVAILVLRKGEAIQSLK